MPTSVSTAPFPKPAAECRSRGSHGHAYPVSLVAIALRIGHPRRTPHRGEHERNDPQNPHHDRDVSNADYRIAVPVQRLNV